MQRPGTGRAGQPGRQEAGQALVIMQGVKLELFIFDSFPLAKRVALLEVHRHEEFAPVKNAPGSASDSPDTARQAILKLHTKCEPAVRIANPKANLPCSSAPLLAQLG